MSKQRLAEGTLNPIAHSYRSAESKNSSSERKARRPKYPAESQFPFIIVIGSRRRFSIWCRELVLQIPPDFATSYPI